MIIKRREDRDHPVYGKQLPRPASGDTNILLPASNLVDITVIKICLLRPPSREKCHKVFFSRTQQNGASRF